MDVVILTSMRHRIEASLRYLNQQLFIAGCDQISRQNIFNTTPYGKC